MQSHETDTVSLAFAVIFIAIGGVFLTGRVDAYDFVTVWAFPVLLLATGLVLAAVALSRHRHRATDEEDALRVE